MLKLPDDQTVFAPQTVATVHQVHDAAGADWEPDARRRRAAARRQLHQRVLARRHGLGRQPPGSRRTWRSRSGARVDVIAQNDSGAFATRQALARELAGGEDRLAGKRVVVWEFASRELAVGDWKPHRLVARQRDERR